MHPRALWPFLVVFALTFASACGPVSPTTSPVIDVGGADASSPPSTTPIAAASAPSSEDDLALPIGPDDATRGSRSARVTIVVFSDFQCPYCKRVEPTIADLRKAYGDKLRIVWKDMPLGFHVRAEPAAQLARAARAQKGDAAFWAMHDALFDAQPMLEDADLERLAVKNGLDAKKAMADVTAKKHDKAIAVDKELAALLGATGTPTAYVNGRKLVGAQPLDKYKQLVDEELARAEALVKSGVAKKDVYAAAIKDGKTKKDEHPSAPRPGLRPQVAPSAPSGPSGPSGPSALQKKDVVVGTGREVKDGDKVRVHYVGTFTDGKEFDSSKKHGSPFVFEVGKGRVIKGWDVGLLGMKVGGKRELTVPPDLAYGDRGVPGAIPPKSTLHFEIELLGIDAP